MARRIGVTFRSVSGAHEFNQSMTADDLALLQPGTVFDFGNPSHADRIGFKHGARGRVVSQKFTLYGYVDGEVNISGCILTFENASR